MKHNMIMQKKYTLKTLTPIHIGYGDVLDPFRFIVDERDGCIYILNIDKFLNKLSSEARDKFIKICDRGDIYSIIEIYKFMNSQVDIVKNNPDIIARKIYVSQFFIKHFNKVKSLSNTQKDLNEINRFMINMLCYNPNINEPIIPGSSIKGSIRTAIVNHYTNTSFNEDIKRLKNQVRRENNKKKLNNLSNFLEKRSIEYSNATDDPMKVLKVSDFVPKKDVKSRIIYALNLKKDGSRARGPIQLFEVIEEGSEFEGTISILNMKSEYVKKINLDIMHDCIDKFYSKIFKEQNPSLSYYTGGYMLKLGRHSGAEAMTVEGFRKIWIKGRGRGGRWGDAPTTVWVVSESKRADGARDFALVELIPEGMSSKRVTHKKKVKASSKDSGEKKTPKNLDLSALQGKFKIRKK